MGLSSQKTTTGLSKQAMPYLQAGSGALQSVYDANKGNIAEIGSDLMGQYRRFSDSVTNNPTLGAARRFTADTINSDPSSNPQLDNIINTSNNDIMDRINAIFSRAGQTRSSRQIGEVAKQLSANESGLRYNDWNAGQDRKAQAVQQAIAMGGLDNQTSAALAALAEGAATTPYIGAQILSQGLGNLWGNSTTTKQSNNIGQMLLNASSSAAAAAAAASDRRLKCDIKKVGQLADGLGVYSYRYIPAPNAEIAAFMPNGSAAQIGVMADEVAQLRPWALGPEIAGFQTVNYGAL